MVKSQRQNDGLEYGDEDTDELLATEVSSETVSIRGERQCLVALAELFQFYSTRPELDCHTHWWKCPEVQTRLLTIVLHRKESELQSADILIDSDPPERLFVVAGCLGMKKLEGVVRGVIASGQECRLFDIDGVRGPHRSLVFGLDEMSNGT